MTTFASLVTSISGLVVTGTTRKFTSTPESLGKADLPAQFVRLPSGDAGYAPADCDETEMTRTIELVICIEPSSLEMTATNFADTVTFLDRLYSSISTWAYLPAQNGVAISYSLSTSGNASVIVGNTAYWAVIATIVARG